MNRTQQTNQILNQQDRIIKLGLSSLKTILRQQSLQLIQARTPNQISQILHQFDQSLISTLSQTMTIAHLTAQEQLTKSVNKLSLTDDAINKYKNRLGDSEVESIIDKYRPRVSAELTKLTNKTEELLQTTLEDSILRGDHVNTSIAKLRAATQNAGISFSQPWAYETLVRTETAYAYNGARIEHSKQMPEVIGFEWSAVGDARSRPEHAALDGIRKHKDDPFWNNNRPPIVEGELAYNCRCTLLEIFSDEEL